MKIFYSAGNHLDNNQQLLRFVNNTNHKVMVAAHLKSSESFTHIHWTLDALYNRLEIKNKQDIFDLLGHAGGPKVSIKQTEILLRELDDFGPDLIISNGEPVSAHLAKALAVKLWYCSPLHLLDGIEWERGDLRYLSLLANTKKFLAALPIAERTLVYSPFGDLLNCPALKPGYEWVQPYWVQAIEHKNQTQNFAIIPNKNRFSKLTKALNCVNFDVTLLSGFAENFTHLQVKSIDDIAVYKEALANCNWLFNTGDTSYLADAIYNTIPKMCVAPSLNEPETLLNAILCKLYGIGDDVAQVELMDKYAVPEIEKSQAKQTEHSYIGQLSTMKLNEKVNELCM